MRFLLATNTLIDMCFKGTAAAQWAVNVPTNELRISVISLAAARECIERDASSAVERGQLKQALETRILTFVANGAAILPFGDREADEWQKWINHDPLDIERDDQLFPIGQDIRMVIATAFVNGLEFVEPDEVYHDELRAFGLSVTSL